MTQPIRQIRAYPFDHDYCTCCGKSSCKRKGKSPAPIAMEYGHGYAALCMTCAKRISAALDQAIATIETIYRRELERVSK